MDVSDCMLISNFDWDPSYLNDILSQDFYEFSELWESNIKDMELVQAVEVCEKYCPVVEDISVDDETLWQAVEEIEYQMSAPETVQYFQFDEEGNMCIFDAGAGCPGSPKLVRPGDELVFSSSSNVCDGQTYTAKINVGSPENNLFPTCPTTTVKSESTRPFNEPLPEVALCDLAHKNFSEETKKKIRWVVKMYREWCQHRHGMGLQYISCDLDDKNTITQDSLMFALCRFITEVKKVNGSDFPGKTLYGIVICIQFHLECMGFGWKIINDVAFKDLKYILDNTMKLLTEQGLGILVRKAQILTHTDEDFLWSLGFLGTGNSTQLLNTVVFVVGKGFTLRAGKEHRALRGFQFNSQFKFLHDNDGEYFLRYSEDIGLKTNKGGLKHRKIMPKQVDKFVGQDPERCPLQIILKYLTLVPKNRTCPAFYLQPRRNFFGKSWYVDCPAGVNKLRDVVKEMCRDAGLPGFYSNHSLRSTAATKLYRNNIDEQLIQEITGHRSLAIRSYKRMSDRQRKLASKCLFGK